MTQLYVSFLCILFHDRLLQDTPVLYSGFLLLTQFIYVSARLERSLSHTASCLPLTLFWLLLFNFSPLPPVFFFLSFSFPHPEQFSGENWLLPFSSLSAHPSSCVLVRKPYHHITQLRPFQGSFSCSCFRIHCCLWSSGWKRSFNRVVLRSVGLLVMITYCPALPQHTHTHTQDYKHLHWFAFLLMMWVWVFTHKHVVDDSHMPATKLVD